MRNTLALVLIVLTAAAACARPDCGNNVWRDDCNNPTLEVFGDVVSVSFTAPMTITGGWPGSDSGWRVAGL